MSRFEVVTHSASKAQPRAAETPPVSRRVQLRAWSCATATLATLLGLSTRTLAQTPGPIECGDDLACQVLSARLGAQLGSLKITKGKLLYDQSDATEHRLSDSGCTHRVAQTSAHVSATLETDQLLTLRGNPFKDTLLATVKLPVTARAEAGIRESLGVDIFSCHEYAHDNYTASGSLA